MDLEQATTILHLSDLHFSAKKESNPIDDAERWYGQLACDLTRELKCKRLDGLVISGDVGNCSEPEEYSAAAHFIERLSKQFKLQKEQVVIVPGNHDLNWKLSDKGYRLMDKKNCKRRLNEGEYIEVIPGVIRLRIDIKYRKRFQHFSKFHENVTGLPYSLEPKHQTTIRPFPELKIVIIGFNSCWEVDHSPQFQSRVSINPDAFEHALSQLRENEAYEDWLKVAVWHHPLYSPSEDRIKDYGLLQRLTAFGFKICLHGHIHKADAGFPNPPPKFLNTCPRTISGNFFRRAAIYA